jgi:hypothetical protein
VTARAAITTRFPGFGAGGGYESYYLRAVDPDRPRGVWLRHTIHQAPGATPVGSIWLTLIDGGGGPPVTRKVTLPAPEALDGGVRIGASAFAPGAVRGSAGDASWDLAWAGSEPVLRHLPKDLMYSGPLPRTKLESPHPSASFRGEVTVAGETVRLEGWPGMVGHNWGTQHAERWIWLHGVGFRGLPGAWLDLSLGRVRVGRLTTPWIANGAIGLDGRRHRIGGTLARPRVDEHPTALDLRIAGGPTRLRLTVHSRREQTVVWRYADPDGAEHHVANCSVAELEAVVNPAGGMPVTLHTEHGGTYELGMREVPQGLAIQPFGDP